MSLLNFVSFVGLIRRMDGAPGSAQGAGSICRNAVLPEYEYCVDCLCDGWDDGAQCQKARCRDNDRRWCTAHSKTRVAKPGKTYANCTGVWHYGPSWSLPLKVVAKAQFMLNGLDPSDLTALVDFVVLLAAPKAGWPIATGTLVAAFLAGCIKWPTLVVPEGIRLQRVPIFP